MKRSEFIKSLGLGASGLILPRNLLSKSKVKIYDNYIRGINRYNYSKIKSQIAIGDELQLIREESNIHDVFAVQVFYDGYKLGYLTAYENIVIAHMLDAEVELKSYVSEWGEDKDSYSRMAIEIFAERISPTPQLITALQNTSADEVVDVYRKGYKI
ncbi:MAG: hiran domain protein [Flavobacteriia bacterium]|nr:MAG: hiran domain protein [Flavobacteriia bacterium]